ncbi:MAG: hypothetical protein VYA34_17135 [Myxococcota bacterium]|nr:hypothetical protein [Myxococcota bacterium]
MKKIIQIPLVLMVAASGLNCSFFANKTPKDKLAEGQIDPFAPQSNEKEGWSLELLDGNGDNKPDVYRYVQFKPDAPNRAARKLKKEVDINFDGTINLVVEYDSKERPLTEKSDLNFDGQFDVLTIYREGRMIRKEIDTDYNGIIDVIQKYSNGLIEEIESDQSGNGTIDTWEYYENGKLDRLAFDRTGDGNVDEWHRRPKASPTQVEPVKDNKEPPPAEKESDALDAETEKKEPSKTSS